MAIYNKKGNMGKKVIKINEGTIKRIVSKSLKKALKENAEKEDVGNRLKSGNEKQHNQQSRKGQINESQLSKIVNKAVNKVLNEDMVNELFGLGKKTTYIDDRAFNLVDSKCRAVDPNGVVSIELVNGKQYLVIMFPPNSRLCLSAKTIAANAGLKYKTYSPTRNDWLKYYFYREK